LPYFVVTENSAAGPACTLALLLGYGHSCPGI